MIFPNYEKYSNVNKAYNDLFHKLIEVVNKIAPLKTVRIKNASSEWFDKEIAEKLSNDSFSVAETFKNYDSSWVENLVLKLPKPPNSFGMESVNNYNEKYNLEEKLIFANIQTEKVFKILKNFDENKASGIDDLSWILIRDEAKLLTTTITQLCNLSVSSGTFPDACKIAKLKPLFKTGTRTDPKNYRSISLLSLLSKVLERVIHEQTTGFLDKHKTLYKFQSRFRKTHSTDFCLSHLTDKISNGFNSGLLTGMILIDIQSIWYYRSLHFTAKVAFAWIFKWSDWLV